ncbi:DUF58 domain-containing protein [Paenibacillus sp. MER TA 81-3]|uniref:DUF58 domain-containing protein n=1 Tax=Paenibacillus sp. MER TA 81-3 TaxID=2939573 RepID=UPI002040BDB8|nr:DUF58 domain-containing protein [Paenibacillus sp. MER TA 81-3]MCM3342768.1 DUF58 domain-containing protein [Paenibacillus sp. MER TA 81-3]
MKLSLRYAFTALGCGLLAFLGLYRESAAECFLAILLAFMLMHGLWLYRTGTKLRSVQVVHKPSGEWSSGLEAMRFKVTLASRRRLPALWLMATDVWTRTGGDGGAWICRRLLFPRGRRAITYMSSFEGAPRGVYQLARTELTIGDWFGWFGRTVSLAAEEADAPIRVIPPLAVVSEPFDRTVQAGAAPWDMEPDANDSSEVDGDASRVMRHSASGMPGVELQPYRTGAPQRAIDWRTYAKRRVLAVRPLESGTAAACLDLVVDDTDWRTASSDSDKSAPRHTNRDGSGAISRHAAEMEAVLSAAAMAVREATENDISVRLIWLSDGTAIEGTWNAVIALAAERLGERVELPWKLDQGPSQPDSTTSGKLTVVSLSRDGAAVKRVLAYAGAKDIERWLVAEQHLEAVQAFQSAQANSAANFNERPYRAKFAFTGPGRAGRKRGENDAHAEHPATFEG